VGPVVARLRYHQSCPVHPPPPFSPYDAILPQPLMTAQLLLCLLACHASPRGGLLVLVDDQAVTGRVQAQQISEGLVVDLQVRDPDSPVQRFAICQPREELHQTDHLRCVHVLLYAMTPAPKSQG
jgi:hypothetical protein